VVGSQHLQGDVAVQLRVERQPDLADAADRTPAAQNVPAVGVGRIDLGGLPFRRVLPRPEPVPQAVVTLNSNHITNLPEMITAAAVAALTGPQTITEQKCAEFQAKRDQVLAVIDAIPGIVCPRPQGAFYVFPDISVAFGKSHNGRNIATDADLCDALLDAKGVACVPGSAFGEPKALRISYTCPTPQLAEGLKRFRGFFAELA
jgi:aspartate aminotransferase